MVDETETVRVCPSCQEDVEALPADRVCDECETEAAKFVEEVAEFGAAEARRARGFGEVWSEWAAAVEHLAALMPHRYQGPHYMDIDGEHLEVHLGAGHVDLVQLRAHLARAVAGADAIAAAAVRAAERCTTCTAAKLAELRPQEEGEDRG